MLIKNEAEIEKAEQDRLKKTCEAAENAQEDLKEKATVTEVFIWPTSHHLIKLFLKWKTIQSYLCMYAIHGFATCCSLICSQMKVQDLEEQLNTEITKNTEQTCQMEQLRKDFTQQK